MVQATVFAKRHPVLAERVLAASLLRPNSGQTNAALNHLADLILPKTQVSIRVQPLTDSSSDSAGLDLFTNDIQAKLPVADFENALIINAGGSDIFHPRVCFCGWNLLPSPL